MLYQNDPRKNRSRAFQAIESRIMALPREQISAWKEAHGYVTGHRRGFPLRIETCHLWTPEHLESVCVALFERVMSFSDPLDAQAMLWVMGPVMRIVSSFAITLAVERQLHDHLEHSGVELIKEAAEAAKSGLILGRKSSVEMRRRLKEFWPHAHEQMDLANVLLLEADELVAPSPFRPKEPLSPLHSSVLRRCAHYSQDQAERSGYYGSASGIARAKSAMAGSIADGLETCVAFYGRTER